MLRFSHGETVRLANGPSASRPCALLKPFGLGGQVAANCTCIDKFAKLFMKFDTDNSGVLDTPELVPGSQRCAE